MNYKFLDHTADVEFQAFGNTLEESFENAARALFASMYDGKIKKNTTKNLSISGKDKKSLLYNFLEELLFLLDTENFFLSDVSVRIEGDSLKATLQGDSAENYEISLQVKAITYHNMSIKEEDSKWVSQVVVDV